MPDDGRALASGCNARFSEPRWAASDCFELTTTRMGNRAKIRPKECNAVYDALYLVAQNRNSRSNTVAASEIRVNSSHIRKEIPDETTGWSCNFGFRTWRRLCFPAQKDNRTDTNDEVARLLTDMERPRLQANRTLRPQHPGNNPGGRLPEHGASGRAASRQSLKKSHKSSPPNVRWSRTIWTTPESAFSAMSLCCTVGRHSRFNVRQTAHRHLFLDRCLAETRWALAGRRRIRAGTP